MAQTSTVTIRLPCFRCSRICRIIGFLVAGTLLPQQIMKSLSFVSRGSRQPVPPITALYPVVFASAHRVRTRPRLPRRLKNANPHFSWMWLMTPE